jgi:hypothetical protein
VTPLPLEGRQAAWARTFSTRIKARRSGARPPPPEPSPPVFAPAPSRPASGWRRAERWNREERQMPPAGLPQGSSTGKAAGRGWCGSTRIFPSPVTRWAARRRPTPQGQAASRSASPSLAPPTVARQNRVCRPRGRSEQPRLVGCGPAGETVVSGAVDGALVDR